MSRELKIIRNKSKISGADDINLLKSTSLALIQKY